jgi:hypothetical protein
MRRKRFLIFSIIVFGTITFLGANAQSKIDEKESARLFVQKFYDWYSALYNADNPGAETQPSSQQVAMKHSREFFSANLQKALTNYYGTPRKDGDIGLDFDPFIAGQDSGPGYETGNIKEAGNKFLVDVHSIKKGETHQAVLAAELIVVAEVTKESGHWVIANFTYVDSGKRYDLLGLLKDQAKG